MGRDHGSAAAAAFIDQAGWSFWKLVPPQYVLPASTSLLSPCPVTLQGNYGEADLLYVRVLEVLGAATGEEHPSYAVTLNNRAGLLMAQVRTDVSRTNRVFGRVFLCAVFRCWT